VVILIGVCIDSIVRNFATINSSYYRLINLPEWTYGFLGAALGILSWFVPSIAKYLNNRFSVLSNLGFIAIAALVGLAALIPAWPIYGIIPAMFLMTIMGFLGFTISRVLHQEADSSKRATLLSVKGLAFNLGYGLFSLGFSGLLASFPNTPEGTALRSALLWQMPLFALMVMGLFIWANRYLRPKKYTH
jgi:small-conductance mechanosensitive channel